MAGQPRWQEIAEDLNRRIQEGEFGTGAAEGRLPTELELREQYGASRNTIRDALRWLAEHNVVETERGRGTFVVFRPEPLHVTLSARSVGPGGGEGQAWRFDAEVQGRRSDPTDSVKVEVQRATDEAARYLQLPPGTQVVLRTQWHRIDRQPWSIQTSYYPLGFAVKGASRLLEAVDLPEGTVTYLKETLGYEQVGYHDEIAVRVPERDEMHFFGLSEGANVLFYETFRTAYDRSGLPFRLTVTVWPADRNRLHYNVGDVPQAIVERPGEPHLPNRGDRA